MSDTADPITSTETGQETSPPLSPEPYDEQKPPPYSEASAVSPPLKSEAACTDEPLPGYQSCNVINAEMGPNVAEATIMAPSCFEDETVRRGFIRKVFCILTLQLLFTFGVVCVFTFSSVVKAAVQASFLAYLLCFITFPVFAITLTMCESWRRRYPWNMMALVVVTLTLAYMMGTIASYHDTTSVLISIGSTMAVSLAIIGLSVQTRFEFSCRHSFLLVLAVNMLMFVFFCTFYYTHISEIGFGCLGALLFSLFLWCDVQLMVGVMNDRLDPEEYIYAALMLYLDIFFIFSCLVARK